MEMTTEKLLRPDEVAEMYGVTRVTVWAWAKAGRIPRPIVQRPHYTRWLHSEVVRAIRAMRDTEKAQAAS